MSPFLRTAFLSMMVTCVSASVVQAQTLDFGQPIQSAADSRFSEPAPAQALSSTSTFKTTPKTPNFFKQTLIDFGNLSSTNTLTWLAIGAVASTSVHPMDMSVTRQMSSAPAMEQLRAGNIIGGKEFQFGASVAALAIGKMSGHTRVSDVAGKVLRAQIVAQTVTGVIKQTAQRNRPDSSDMRSFPSGHTSVSFASATVLQRELGWIRRRGWHPRRPHGHHRQRREAICRVPNGRAGRRRRQLQPHRHPEESIARQQPTVG
jgi:membrane-associated phospholipid phosphatase